MGLLPRVLLSPTVTIRAPPSAACAVLPLAVSPGFYRALFVPEAGLQRRSLCKLHAMLTKLFIIGCSVVSATVAAAQAVSTVVPGPAPASLAAPPPVPREFRAAWVSPMYDRGIRDWPSSPNLSPDQQRAELTMLLDDAVAIGLNTVILHVRVAGDAFYPTKYAPWSALLTGHSGIGPSPPYDPLAYAVAQAHARGLQLHAWFNPFRAALPGVPGKAAASHVTRQHPDWIVRYGKQTWIDPGNPVARNYVLETILDVARRYDVDGIHLDDYFYPYRETRTYTRRVKRRRVRVTEEISFADGRSWKKYGVARGFTDRDAWRRSNIDDFVRALYTGVKAIRPSIAVGISPFGIWRPGSPAGITGLDAFSEIYADSRRWLQEGWVDYLVPQLYWEVDGTQNRFRALDAWWRGENPQRRFVWPGLYTSRVLGGGLDTWPIQEIQTQIATIRDARSGTADAPGHVHFRLGALIADDDRVGRTLAATYADRALVPAFTWLGATPPSTPSIGTSSSASTLKLVSGDASAPRWWLVQVRGAAGVWWTKLQPGTANRFAMDSVTIASPDEVAVSAISPTGVASDPAVIAWPATTVGSSAPGRARD